VITEPFVGFGSGGETLIEKAGEQYIKFI